MEVVGSYEEGKYHDHASNLEEDEQEESNNPQIKSANKFCEGD